MWEQLRLTDVADLRADITTDGWPAIARDYAPSVVFHLAAQSLVSIGYEQPARTFEVNVHGTVRVLDFVASLDEVAATLVITTDKVYDPAQAPPHDENHSLGGREPYSASKAAVRSLARTWAAELKVRGIRVNVVSPGSIDTALFSTVSLEFREQITAAIPLGRLGTSEEIGTAALFLASSDSSFITGANLVVDGGFSQI